MPAECCSVVFLSKLILQLLTVTLSNFELIIELETIETLFVPSAVTFSKCRSVTLEDFKLPKKLWYIFFCISENTGNLPFLIVWLLPMNWTVKLPKQLDKESLI